jgi:LmbE family N-acetylglucosaminyl deacetylase
MVVVVPHPDDEALAVGGLIAAQCSRGLEITVVAVTDGEHAYEQNQGLAAVRQSEQQSALARLGVSSPRIMRLGMEDSNVAALVHELIAKFRPLVDRNTLLVAPWSGDFHPDHEACGKAADIVAQEAQATLISYFFWTWHRGSLATLDGLKLRKFALTEDLRIAKREALACHASQLRHAPEPEILPENLLWPARMPFEVFAL